MAISIVALYIVLQISGSVPRWTEYVLAGASIVGIGLLVARSKAKKPFRVTFALSLATLAALETIAVVTVLSRPVEEQPWVMSPLAVLMAAVLFTSAMMAAVAGLVALGFRDVFERLGRSG